MGPDILTNIHHRLGMRWIRFRPYHRWIGERFLWIKESMGNFFSFSLVWETFAHGFCGGEREKKREHFLWGCTYLILECWATVKYFSFFFSLSNFKTRDILTYRVSGSPLVFQNRRGSKPRHEQRFWKRQDRKTLGFYEKGLRFRKGTSQNECFFLFLFLM